MRSAAQNRRLEFGDFQTPLALARRVVCVLRSFVPKPAAIIEPTCGRGSFLLAAREGFPAARQIVGADINAAHLEQCRHLLGGPLDASRVRLLEGDFFSFDWGGTLAELASPMLVVGNPPWVTSSELGRLGSSNLPPKRVQRDHRGLDAVTGKSNFDVSESMLFSQLQWFDQRHGTVAALCKESVARKVLARAWRQNLPISSARMYRFDAAAAFGVSVAACLLVVVRDGVRAPTSCEVFEALSADTPCETLGFADGLVVRDLGAYQRWRHLRGTDGNYLWRSGLKHDCARVMELTEEGEELRNGLGERVDIEREAVYPLFKSADIANGQDAGFRKLVVVTQKQLYGNTKHLRETLPKTWRYLNSHREAFSRRSSVIYQGRPEFSMFGIGDYSFALWKVAVPGLYRVGRPIVLSPIGGRPAMLDDTAYFLPCASEREARFLMDLLASDPALRFFNSLVFPTDKRPLNAGILRQLHIGKLARELGRDGEYDALTAVRCAQTGWGDPRRRLFEN